MDAQTVDRTTNFLLGSGAVGLAPQIIAGTVPLTSDLFDGKRLRKTVYRKTVDYSTFGINSCRDAFFDIDPQCSSLHNVKPHLLYAPHMGLPITSMDSIASSIPTRFLRQAQNKLRSAVNAITWTHDGRRLVAGSAHGELTLWNSMTFNFDTIMQAHDNQITSLMTSNFEEWIISADNKGFIKYWQSNLNCVVAYQGHFNSSITSMSFCPTDRKFVTGGTDGTVRIWDFGKCADEKVYREHGGDVAVASWHATKGLIASGSRDWEQSLKLWDPRASKSITTLYIHKNAVSDVKWNANGHWFITASRDSSIKLMDLRNLQKEVSVFRSTKQSSNSSTSFVPNKVAWHPVNTELFAAGSCNGSLQYWLASLPSTDECIFEVDDAHDSCINCVLWHPLGHVMVSASSDYTSKFWSRDRPGEHTGTLTKATDISDSISELIKDGDNNLSEVAKHSTGDAPDSSATRFNFNPPVNYGPISIPNIRSSNPGFAAPLFLPNEIDLSVITPMSVDLTSIIPHSFWSSNPPKNLKRLQ